MVKRHCRSRLRKLVTLLGVLLAKANARYNYSMKPKFTMNKWCEQVNSVGTLRQNRKDQIRCLCKTEQLC